MYNKKKPLLVGGIGYTDQSHKSCLTSNHLMRETARIKQYHYVLLQIVGS